MNPSPHQRLRERLAARLASNASKPFQGNKKPFQGTKGSQKLPEAVIKRQEETSALLEAAKAARERRKAKAVNTHPEFAKLMAILSRELTETRVVEPGLVDLDFEHVIRGLKVHKLPHPVRFLALEEAMSFIKAVHKRHLKTTDITPYKHLFTASFVDSLAEARNALQLH